MSFEIATEREHDYHGFNCCLEYTHSGKKKAPNLWIGPDDVDGRRCENRVRGWTTYQFSSRIDGVPCSPSESEGCPEAVEAADELGCIAACAECFYGINSTWLAEQSSSYESTLNLYNRCVEDNLSLIHI